MINWCPYKKYRDLIGAPGTGVHKYKFLNTSIVDYFVTLLGIFVITFLTGFPLELVTIFIYTAGVISHILFGLPTHSTKFLGFTCDTS
jgi:hypothetical protein